jgi:ribosomal protein S18 acetylase RimI-like enzyme
VQAAVHEGERVVLAAVDGRGTVLGTGQLALEARANGRHRAEVQKLMVAPAARRRGIARALMLALEDAARAAGRTLLVLDTREGDAAAALYAALGWTLAGRVPGYVLERDGTYTATSSSTARCAAADRAPPGVAQAAARSRRSSSCSGPTPSASAW